MFRVRLINKVIGPTSAAQHPVCGISGKLYGQATFIPARGGPVLDMGLEDYDAAKFDIIGNTKYRQQWVPEFYECIPVVQGDGSVTYEEIELNVMPDLPGENPTGEHIRWKPDNPLVAQHQEQIGAMVVNGQNRLQQFNELRKRAKAAGVWKPGMNMAEAEKALTGNHGPGALTEVSL